MSSRSARTRVPRLTEVDVTRQITDLCKAEGWWCMRLQSGLFVAEGRIVKVGEKGLPDWVFIKRSSISSLNPTCLFVEIKRPGGKPSPDQLAWIDWANKNGLCAGWTDSLDGFINWKRLMLGERRYA